MAGLVVKPRARILHGHDWVFSSEVLKVFGKPADGDVIFAEGRTRSFDWQVRFTIPNRKSPPAVSRDSGRISILISSSAASPKPLNTARGDMSIQNCGRLVWSESDGLPGVIIDRYGDHFVLQTLTLGDGYAERFDRECDCRSFL